MSELVERWPGYDEQSWAERFAELNRRHDGLFRSFNALHEEAIKALAEKRDRIEALERELAAERERCARIAESITSNGLGTSASWAGWNNAKKAIAAAIRNGEAEQ